MDNEVYDAVYSISGQRKRRGYQDNTTTLPADTDVLEMARKINTFLEAFPGQTKVRDLRVQIEEIIESLGGKPNDRDPDTPPDMVRRS